MKNLNVSPHYDQGNILVTSPLLPPLEEFMPYLEDIWQSKRLTNGGPYHQRLEAELSRYLGVEHISLFTNGTLALMTAMQALRITGEVITTPYSFVATSHSLVWNGIKPVFVDVDPITCNLDPDKIEAAITPATTAIMPVHCYGIPCNMDKIQDIADKYGLKVIYDAAHAFGVKQDGTSILQHGDASILSFHATKVFNTFEGGAIICQNEKLKKRIDYLKNFGFADEVTVVAAGINGKMNEIQAAFGLLQLQYIDDACSKRQEIYENYLTNLSGLPGIRVGSVPEDTEWNYSYCPIFIDNDNYNLTRDNLYNRLKEYGVYARRYFYPLISEFPMYKGEASASEENLKQAMSLSRQVLCLPVYPTLSEEQQRMIIELIVSLAHAKAA